MAESARGLVRAICMARPGRGARERAAIAAAFEMMPADLSKRAKAAVLAKRVASIIMSPPLADDPFGAALARLSATSDPAHQLARDPDIDLAAIVRGHRAARFDARGCQQLSPTAWHEEGKEIAAILERQLAERFRR